MEARTVLLLTLIGVVFLMRWSGAISCDSCGAECAASCGTRQFRACCFNYLKRKRSAPLEDRLPGLKLEVWLAKNHGMWPPLPVAVAKPMDPRRAASQPDESMESALQLVYDA